MDRNVWIGTEDEPAWHVGGSYMVVRKINMRMETWDQQTFTEQESIIGRQKRSGAPMDGTEEFDALDSHVRLSNPRSGESSERERILRRDFNFFDGLDPFGRMNAGLLFICYNRNTQNQFESIQKRLSNPNLPDKLLSYTHTVGGGYYAALPGVKKIGGYLGQGLF